MKPGFFKNEDLAACGMAARVLFAGLWCFADRKGRLEDRPIRIKAEIFPYDDSVKVDDILSKLDAAGFIKRYKNGSGKFIQIINFHKHQNPHVKEQDSTIQAPGKHRASTGNSGTCRADSLLPITDPLNPLTDSLNPIKPSPSVPLVAGLDSTAWATWVDYRKQIRKPLKPASILAAQRKLAAFGCDQYAVVEQSIANGWTGIFQLKNGGTHATHQHVDNSAPARVKRANDRQREAERRRKPIDV